MTGTAIAISDADEAEALSEYLTSPRPPASREDNAALNKTYFYEYDDFGNIEKVTTYNYTTGNSLTGGVTRTYAYDSDKRR